MSSTDVSLAVLGDIAERLERGTTQVDAGEGSAASMPRVGGPR